MRIRHFCTANLIVFLLASQALWAQAQPTADAPGAPQVPVEQAKEAQAKAPEVPAAKPEANPEVEAAKAGLFVPNPRYLERFSHAAPSLRLKRAPRIEKPGQNVTPIGLMDFNWLRQQERLKQLQSGQPETMYAPVAPPVGAEAAKPQPTPKPTPLYVMPEIVGPDQDTKPKE